LLIGSVLPKADDDDHVKAITLLPLRFASPASADTLSLSLLATTRNGPARYAVAFKVSGALTCAAVRELADKHADIWEKTHLKSGLWIGDGASAVLLNDLSQIKVDTISQLGITGMFLHSDLRRTIQHGVMTMGVLYRSVLDELAGADRVRRLYAQLNASLDNRASSFQRMVRP
jgi:hypothetical protein